MMWVNVLCLLPHLFIFIIYILSKSVSSIGAMVWPLNPKTIAGTVLVCPTTSASFFLILSNLLTRASVSAVLVPDCTGVIASAFARGRAVCWVLRQTETKMESIPLESNESLRVFARSVPCGVARGALQSEVVLSACRTT